MDVREQAFLDELVDLVEQYRDVEIAKRWGRLTEVAMTLFDSAALNNVRRAATEEEYVSLCRRHFRDVRKRIGVPSLAVSPPAIVVVENGK